MALRSKLLLCLNYTTLSSNGQSCPLVFLTIIGWPWAGTTEPGVVLTVGDLTSARVNRNVERPGNCPGPID